MGGQAARKKKKREEKTPRGRPCGAREGVSGGGGEWCWRRPERKVAMWHGTPPQPHRTPSALPTPPSFRPHPLATPFLPPPLPPAAVPARLPPYPTNPPGVHPPRLHPRRRRSPPATAPAQPCGKQNKNSEQKRRAARHPTRPAPASRLGHQPPHHPPSPAPCSENSRHLHSDGRLIQGLEYGEVVRTRNEGAPRRPPSPPRQ